MTFGSTELNIGRAGRGPGPDRARARRAVLLSLPPEPRAARVPGGEPAELRRRRQ